MDNISKAESFRSNSDFLDAYIDGTVGVINLKDKIFEIATDLPLKEEFFKKIHLARLIPDIEVLLIMSAESAMGEDEHARFMKSMADSLGGERRLFREENALSQFIQLMCGFEKIVVSGVRGSVVGAFLGAILSTDFRIACETTVFSFPHIKYEMPPQGGLVFFLSRYLGFGKAKRLLLTGESLTAAAAQELGLVDEVIANDVFEKSCVAIAKRISIVPPSVVGMTKRLMECELQVLQTYFRRETELLTTHDIKPRAEENHQ